MRECRTVCTVTSAAAPVAVSRVRSLAEVAPDDEVEAVRGAADAVAAASAMVASDDVV